MISSPDIEPQRSQFEDQVAHFFSPHGRLSESHDFEYRAEQQLLAQAIAGALDKNESLVAEAGTGVGKSMAYLLPALMHSKKTGKKAVISTHTINLQEQLMLKDLPLIRGLMGWDFKAALLKGRGNYLCPQRLKRAIRQSGDLFTSSESDELKAILEWSLETRDGTKATLEMDISPKVWHQVCSDPYLCNQRTCGRGEECFYFQARRKVLEADIIVLNHTLLFGLLQQSEFISDLDSESYIFPNDFLILDEAHTLEAVASGQLGLNISELGLKFQVQRLYHPRTKKGILSSFGDPLAIQSCLHLFDKVGQFFESLEQVANFQGIKREYRVHQAEVVPNTLASPLRELAQRIDMIAEDVDSDHSRSELKDAARRLRELSGELSTFLDQKEDGCVYWIQKNGESTPYLSLHSSPIRLSGRLKHMLFAEGKSAILCSATMGVGDELLTYFRQRIGASQVKPLQIGSPFDFKAQMRLVLVKSIPEPNDKEYENHLVYWIHRSLKATKGKAFVLFTGYSMMKRVAQRLRKTFETEKWRLLVQGEGLSRTKMISEFKADLDSVLFGTDSFWTGVDVPGEALSNVIVTRLPFAVPDHPVTSARIEEIEAKGGSSFMEYTVPEAIIKLRQGVGRLIRSKKDKGIVVILDNRVVSKAYGKLFLNSLPKAPTKIITEVPNEAELDAYSD